MLRTLKVQITEELLKEIQGTAKRLGTSRSEFARRVLRDALNRPDVTALENKHREGYRNNPVRKDEFSVWEAEQVWPE
jgi:metal-responsive CopG/Arc/MetJ family transcriptional regulator